MILVLLLVLLMLLCLLLVLLYLPHRRVPRGSEYEFFYLPLKRINHRPRLGSFRLPRRSRTLAGFRVGFASLVVSRRAMIWVAAWRHCAISAAASRPAAVSAAQADPIGHRWPCRAGGPRRVARGDRRPGRGGLPICTSPTPPQATMHSPCNLPCP